MFNPFRVVDAVRVFHMGALLLLIMGGVLILGMAVGFFIGVVVTDSELGDMAREYFQMVQADRDEICDY